MREIAAAVLDRLCLVSAGQQDAVMYIEPVAQRAGRCDMLRSLPDFGGRSPAKVGQHAQSLRHHFQHARQIGRVQAAFRLVFIWLLNHLNQNAQPPGSRGATICAMKSEPKNKGGRPFKPDDQRLVQRSIRLLPAQWAKFDAEGGVKWLRDLIDRSKSKAPTGTP
jgi:hypothetical protein